MGKNSTIVSAPEVFCDGTRITHLSRRSISQADCNKYKLSEFSCCLKYQITLLKRIRTTSILVSHQEASTLTPSPLFILVFVHMHNIYENSNILFPSQKGWKI